MRILLTSNNYDWRQWCLQENILELLMLTFTINCLKTGCLKILDLFFEASYLHIQFLIQIWQYLERGESYNYAGTKLSSIFDPFGH